MVGDTKLVLWQLIVELDRRGALKRKDITNEIEAVKRTKAEKYDSLMESGEPPVNPYRVYAEIMASLDRKNRFVTHESGNTRDQLSTVCEAIIPYGFMGWGNVSTLGFSLGVAMGAKLAIPGREIVSVNGDAGFSYQVGNYEAVVSSRLGITTGHINNSGYSPVFWGNGHSPYTSEVTPFDIVNTSRVVEGLGIHSERIEDPDEVAPALGSALK